MQEVQPTWGQLHSDQGDPWVYMQDEIDEKLKSKETQSERSVHQHTFSLY
jgi:hypothetical protein